MKNDAVELKNGQLQKFNRGLWKQIIEHRYLYLLLLPLIVFYIVFAYVPMYGVTLAFKTFDFSRGIMGSPWNNFQNFKDVLGNVGFLYAFRNTLLISFGRLIIEFPIPILMALMLNEITKSKIKRVYQTIFTFPHFLSWVILSGIIVNVLSDQGILNQILMLMGFEKNTVMFNNSSFIAMLFTTSIWKEAGWSTILYLASIAGINPELYEAATVDGANRFQQMRAITWPTVKTTATILLVLAVGGVMNGGFDQIFNLYNPTVYKYADIIDTYVYRSAFVDATGFGYTTTVGFMKSILNFIFLFGADRVVKAMGQEGGL